MHYRSQDTKPGEFTLFSFFWDFGQRLAVQLMRIRTQEMPPDKNGRVYNEHHDIQQNVVRFKIEYADFRRKKFRHMLASNPK